MRFLFLFFLSVAAAQAGVDPEVAELPRLPALSPAEALRTFHLSPGFSISAAAVEPQVVDPVSISFDKSGAMFVAEMRDYSERRAEKLSRIRKLTDRDGDGVFETSTIFMDGLAWATSVLCYRGAVYVAATPDLWRLRDTDGDGVADVKEVIFTGFGEGTQRLNVQALFNSLTVGPDGRIHGAAAANGGNVHRPGASAGQGSVSVRGADFSFDPETLDFRAEPGGGQFGLTYDAWGRCFVCSNSHHIQWIAPLPTGGFLPPPEQLVDIPVDGAAAPVFRLSPDEPWRVLRTNWRASGLVPGLVEGDGKASGYFTSASGIHIWRRDAIVADCGSNLVHRKQFRETLDGPVAERPASEKDREFLASTDTWFRPVAFATGPEGDLFVVDMVREFIEHPDSLPPNLKAKMDLNSGNDRGRIWRVKANSGTPLAAAVEPFPELREIVDTPAGDRPAHWKRWWDAIAGDLSGRTARALFASLRNVSEAQEFYGVCGKDLPEARALELAARLEIPVPPGLRPTVSRLFKDVGNNTAQRLDALRILVATEPEANCVAAAKLIGEAERVRIFLVTKKPAAAVALLDDWKELSGPLRSVVVSSLGGRSGGPALLLEKIQDGLLSAGDIPPALAASWRTSGTPEVRRLAAELLPAPSLDRSAAIAARQSALTLTGDSAKGGVVFQQRCAVCHKDGDTGFAVGPDRASFRNKGKPLLLLAVLDPDREVAPQFARTTVTGKDGGLSAGITVSESLEGIRLMMPAGQEVNLPRSGISKIERDAGSLMPSGVDEGLTNQEMADLLAWLTR